MTVLSMEFSGLDNSNLFAREKFEKLENDFQELAFEILKPALSSLGRLFSMVETFFI